MGRITGPYGVKSSMQPREPPRVAALHAPVVAEHGTAFTSVDGGDVSRRSFFSRISPIGSQHVAGR